MTAPREVTAADLTDEIHEADAALARIPIERSHDPHLATCGLAKASGSDATLACVECGRAKWMHSTRHDTCSLFSYVHYSQLTEDMLIVLRLAPSTSREVRVLCSHALNDFGLSHGRVFEAKRLCAEAFNRSRAAVVARIDAINARSKGA